MNDLNRLEGKIIKDISENSDGKTSQLIIKFEEGGKLNIVSYPNGDKGVGQLDIELGNLSKDDLIGKRIHTIAEEFDGINDFIVINFKDGNKMTVTSFCTAEEGSASLDTYVYSSDNLVAESLEENMYTDDRNGEYPLNKPQYENGYEPGTYGNKDEYMKNLYKKDGNFVSIVIKSHPRTDNMILRMLNDEFQLAKYAGGVGSGGVRIIDVFDEDATVENVSDLLYKYIEKGTVLTVDNI
jgi:hypothetical protein